MRKKGKKAIIPEGAELMDYLNRGVRDLQQMWSSDGPERRSKRRL